MKVNSLNAGAAVPLQASRAASVSKVSFLPSPFENTGSARAEGQASTTAPERLSLHFFSALASLNEAPAPAATKLLVGVDDYVALRDAGRANVAKPNVREFMNRTGLGLKAASELLYGGLGAVPDMRNWSEIMASSDPAKSAREATSALLSSVSHASYIAESLKSAGYR